MAVLKETSFDEWVTTVPERIKKDPLWNSMYYQKAMYLYDLVWLDCETLNRDFRGREIVHQLVRSAGGISANIEEGYGRGIGTPDFIRILRISLGEARETQGWYTRSRHILPRDIWDNRMSLIDQVIAMIVNAIRKQSESLRPNKP